MVAIVVVSVCFSCVLDPWCFNITFCIAVITARQAKNKDDQVVLVMLLHNLCSSWISELIQSLKKESGIFIVNQSLRIVFKTEKGNFLLTHSHIKNQRMNLKNGDKQHIQTNCKNHKTKYYRIVAHYLFMPQSMMGAIKFLTRFWSEVLLRISLIMLITPELILFNHRTHVIDKTHPTQTKWWCKNK